MNEPHVDELQYRFSPRDDIHDFSDAPRWEGQLGDFSVRLEGEVLLATPAGHFASEDEARAEFEPYLRSWELRVDLEDGIPIRFAFGHVSVTDRAPTPGEIGVQVQMAGEVSLAGQLVVLAQHHAFPQPAHTALMEDPLVTDLLASIHEIHSREQRLLVGVYLFLTRLQYEYGGRRPTAEAVAVNEPVLRKLGELSVVNDPTVRRKVEGPERSLTDDERDWLDKAMRKITLQVAQIAAGGTPVELTMADLPKLP